MIGTLFSLKENWIVFYDLFSKNGNGDSIRPLAKEIRRRYPELKFFFVSKTLKHIDMADEIIKPHTLKFNYVVSRAKYLISPMGFPKNKKRDGQIWVQTWHGTPLKKLYLSREDTKKFRKDIKQFEQADFFCASCEFCHQAFKEALLLKEEQFINSGLPRNDILINHKPEFVTELKKEMGIPEGKKVLFYCPTWRRYDYKATLPMNLEKLKSELKDTCCLLIRSHVGKHQWVDKNNNPIEVNDGEFCFNMANYPEIAHLYLVSDVLITDYSSAMFDFGILERPQIFYAYDLEEYKNEFQLYLDYNEIIPGPMALNTDELINCIKNPEDYSQKLHNFKEKFCTYEDGNATKKVTDAMFKRSQL